MHTAPAWLVRLSFERFAAALFFIVIGAAACLMPAQNDTWWQLRAGQEIVTLGTIPLRDTFSFTQAGHYWPNHEWLAQVALYGFYRGGGMPLVTLAAAAAVTASWLVVWQLTPGTTWRRIALSAVAVPVFVNQWSLRPQVFTLLFLALTLLLLVKRREGWLPALFVVWANMHGGVVLGIMVVVAATVGPLIYERRFRRGKVGIAAGCILATTLTPLGLSFWTEIPAALQRSKSYQIAEWLPPGLTDLSLVPYWTIVIALAALVVLVRPWRSSRPSLFMVTCAALALVPVSLSAVRNGPPFLLLAIPAVGALLEDRFPHGTARPRRERPVLHAVALATAAILAVSSVGYAWTSQAPRLQWRPLSEQAIAAVVGCSTPIYNSYDDGGYLIWFVPGQKVFVDSRQDPYPPEFMAQHIRLEATGEYEETFRHHSIGCAFVPTGSLLARRLVDARWRRTYADDRWAVFEEE